jgi:DNA polymerase III subunit epsilon
MIHGRERPATGRPEGDGGDVVTGGVVARLAETRLTERALDYLAAGPADVVALIGHICQLPNPPRVVAEHMAAALFAERTEFARDENGNWHLATRRADAPAEVRAVVPAAPPVPEDHARAVPPRRASTVSERRRVYAPPVQRPVRLPQIDPLVAPREYPAIIGDVAVQPPRIVAPADMLASLSYVVVDVETTGARAWAGDRITEIAAVVVRDGEVREVFETLVNPQRPIPPFITALTNISWAMVKDAPVFADVCDRLLDVMQGHVFVAHNAAFDWRFVTAEVTRANGRRLSGRQLCTVRLARKLLPQLRSRSLDHVAHHYGVTIGARHRAAGDAIATAHVLLRLLRDARDRGCESWPALEELVAKRKARKRRGRPSAMPRSMDRDAGA